MDEERGRSPEEWDLGGLETVDELADDFLDLPLGAQLGILRTVVPRAVGVLDPEAREGFWRRLRAEVDRYAVGEEAYDIRNQQPPRTHRGRREAALRSFLSEVAAKLPEPPPRAALLDQAVSVLRHLGARITEDEFENLLSQLPRNLRERLDEEPPPLGQPRRLDAEGFIARVADEVCGGDRDAAFHLCAAVCRTLTEKLGNAAIKARRQLPIDYLPLFAPEPLPR
ncbi:MAG: DUF2267 domain-containing protein [Myxococcales bacterium]